MFAFSRFLSLKNVASEKPMVGEVVVGGNTLVFVNTETERDAFAADAGDVVFSETVEALFPGQLPPMGYVYYYSASDPNKYYAFPSEK